MLSSRIPPMRLHQVLAEDETLASSLKKPGATAGNHGATVAAHRAALITKAYAIISSEFGCEKPELLAGISPSPRRPRRPRRPISAGATDTRSSAPSSARRSPAHAVWFFG